MKVCKTCWEYTKFEISDECEICCGIFEKVKEIAEKIFEDLKDYEFETFQVGSKVWGSAKAMLELLKFKEINYDLKRVFNEKLTEEIEKKGKKVSKSPEIQIVFDLESFTWEKVVKSVYIYGKYVKRVRGLSQTRWLCKKCNGMGCEFCNFKGKRYDSLEELIIHPTVEIFSAKDAILHGAGREDVDVRTLGNGRPFILEVVEPKKRRVDLEEVEKRVNEEGYGKISVKFLKYAEAKDVEEIKEEKYKKLYRAKIFFSNKVSEERVVEALKKLIGEINQKTPTRVLHRRGDILRVRRLYDAKLLLHRKNKAVVTFLAEAGLYIKELVSGDFGRTKPNLSELLGVDARVEKLDVISVLDEPQNQR
ncbi:MAG: tRNA pseudouridine(54/55) synthase Pus10 [Archaeoglobaceae archaeon]|nr:tRNA pseudouridine(54/55) synthase Pus10 [Archaeoglobaceae archaeon]MCX8152448.1 tRNA pseudouridine(54/55) synthase Pus10 [Archaeoglobaceae archaeon]MDW8013788.1 tRNA pseudouridine(54/55) synthase Pus10 [Archaeoglobaceae archaeon]